MSNPYRLPRTVEPTRYDIELTPDLAAATFSGTVAVALHVLEPTSELIANAIELEISSASVNGKDVTYQLDEANERVTFALGAPVQPGDDVVLRVSFAGVLNDKLRGFYRSTFTDGDGTVHTVATTQMQATDCRRAFPCWDEPDFKAVFGITLVVDDRLVAISNTPERSRADRGTGLVAVTFADTMVMSSYLVAFVVGPLEITGPFDVDGVPMRIVHVPGKSHLTDFARQIGTFSLRWFHDYYGIAYPESKLDLVALPDFAAGAMENVGCITFRENMLLVDPATATLAEEQLVADVVAHEIAHMWFGDLVTMRWWNGIWLNEAFATFMEVAACDAFRTEWQRWTTFALDRQPAFEIDSLAATRPVEFEVNSPDEADGMFDSLTYQKGGSLLRMLEQYLGTEMFRDGVRRYLAVHAYGNTETSDLWDAIEHVSGKPVRRIMDSWIWQRGYPLVNANIDDGNIVLSQQRFRFDGEADATTWSVPVHVRQLTHAASGDTTEHTDIVLLDGDRCTVPLRSPDAAVIVNAGSYGFFRVAYAPALLERLTGARLAELETADLCSLIDDAWAAVVAGHLGAGEFCRFARSFATLPSTQMWQMLLPALSWCDRFVDGAAREQFRSYVREIVGPTLADIGWEPRSDEPALVGELRGLLITALAVLGNDSAAQDKCRALHQQSLTDPTHVDPTVATAALSVVASQGTDVDYDACLARYRAATNPQDKLRELHALAKFPTTAQIDRTLAFAMTDEVKTQNAPFVISRCISHRDHGERAWRFLRHHWDVANERFPQNTIARMVDPVKTLTSPAQRADVAAYFSEHDIPQSHKALLQTLERQGVNVALHERAHADLARAFS